MSRARRLQSIAIITGVIYRPESSNLFKLSEGFCLNYILVAGCECAFAVQLRQPCQPDYKATERLIDQYLYSDSLPKSKSPFAKRKSSILLLSFSTPTHFRVWWSTTKNRTFRYTLHAAAPCSESLLGYRKMADYVDSANNGGFINFYKRWYAEILLNDS